MPDVVTHMACGLLVRAAAGRRLGPAFVLGAVLPDLVSRLPAAALLVIDERILPVPAPLLDAWAPLHLPAGIAAWCALFALLFPESRRRGALATLLAGAALHVALDLCQRHTGLGYPLLAPFSSRDFEIGLFGSEASIPWAPWLGGLAAAACWIRWRCDRARPARAAPGGDPGEGREGA